VYLEATYASGRKVRGRAVRANLAGGALIGYLPQDLQDLKPYFGVLPLGEMDRVTSIRWDTPIASDFSPQITLRWYSIPFRDRSVVKSLSVRRELLWSPGNPVSAVHADIAAGPVVTVVPKETDPIVRFPVDSPMSRFRCVIVRARFQRAGVVNAFFGRESEGRGIEGVLPVAGRWVDVYLNLSANPYWAEEAGRILRFDPPDDSIGSPVEIAGIWGTADNPLPPGQQIAVFQADEP
jgi:hypothetical protein